MNIFVGNLLFEATEGDVKKLFEGFGFVASVVIAMSKEKKAPKSRGFGFVQMPDEQQAFAAIAALNGKEFMGRVLRVNPARPKGHPAVGGAIAKAKTEAQRDNELKEERKKTWFSPVFKKHLALSDGKCAPSGQPGTYRGGRRTRSYISRRGNFEKIDKCKDVNFFKIKPRPRNQDNPMRWRKRKDQSRPWKKTEDESKPWSKSSGRAQKSRPNSSPRLRRGLGMVRGNGGRSRTKGRKKPGGYKR